MTAKKKSEGKYDKLPKSVRGLAERGERYRFPGFWLYDTPRDRIVAAWLDQVNHLDTPAEERVNVTELVKEFLYQVATGQTADKTAQAVISVLGKKIEDLDRKIASGVGVATTGGNPGDVDEAGEIVDRLSAMDD